MSKNSLTSIPYLSSIEKQHCVILMSEDDTTPQVFYHGFRPDSDLLNKMTAVLTRVFELAPSKSALRARLERSTDGFKMHILLSYTEGSFYASGKGENPKRALQRSLDQMYARIRQWRNERIQEEFPDLRRTVRQISASEVPVSLSQGMRPKVLIVDDNPISTKLMESCLRQQGCVTNIATSGSDAVREITNNDYDLLVLDWQMPEMNGPETLLCAQDVISYDSSFRLPWVTNHLPVLTYSGIDIQQGAIPSCTNFEFVGHIRKSATFPELKQQTGEVLRDLRIG